MYLLEHKKVPQIAIFPINQIDSYKNGLIWDYNTNLGALIGKNCQKMLFIQKYLQFSQKLFASIACMLVTFSMSDCCICNFPEEKPRLIHSFVSRCLSYYEAL